MVRSSSGGVGFLRTHALAFGLSGLTALAACTTTTAPQGTAAPAPAPAASCDNAKCKPGNTCIAYEGVTQCRKTCSSNADPATSCPFGYTCIDAQSGEPPFCLKETAVTASGAPLTKKDTGQWGSPCAANKGLENPDCDTEQGFYCYGISPTDGNAYCTRYDCTADLECGPGFWCGQINQTPNVETSKRKTLGAVQKVCLRREYCATCKVDLDCPPVQGIPQHCVQETSGAFGCMPECTTSKNCPLEARCADVGLAAKVCYPRANVCVGDGSLCSPCRVDTDCGEDGACVKGQYTTEKACAKKSATTCEKDGKPSQGSCPQTLEAGSKSDIRCLGSVFEEVPENYCHGIYRMGSEGGDIGCWTPDR